MERLGSDPYIWKTRKKDEGGIMISITVEYMIGITGPILYLFLLFYSRASWTFH